MPTDLDENFPLSYRELHQETEANTNVGSEDDVNLTPTFVWPDDPDEFVYIPFKVSLRRFTAMLSAIDVGGPLAYTDDGFKPYWWFIVNFSGGAMTFCQAMVDAIENCEDVRDTLYGLMQSAIGNVPSVQSAFADWFLADEYIRGVLDSRYAGNATVDPTSSNMSILGNNATCDPDKVFGQCSALVTTLHTATIDLFQAIEEGTNVIERVDLFISALPAAGALLPFDEMAAFVDDLAENGYEDYQSAYDATEYDLLRCGLFCVAKDTCSLSIDQAITFYENYLSFQLLDPSEIIRNIAQFVITGGYPTDDIIYAMHLLVLALIKSKAEVFGIRFDRLGLTLATANPDPDWMIVCEECPEECVPGSNCGNPYVIDDRGIVVCQDEQFVDIELTPLLGNYTCRIGFDVVAGCTFNGWQVLSGTFTIWEQFAPYTQGVRFIGQNPTVDSGDPELTGFQPTQILFFSETPCTIRCQVS